MVKKDSDLDPVTAAVAGAWFSMMRPRDGKLTFGMREARPSAEVERALNILEARKMIRRKPDLSGGVTYTPLVDMSGYLSAARKAPKGIKLTERIIPPRIEHDHGQERMAGDRDGAEGWDGGSGV